MDPTLMAFLVELGIDFAKHEVLKQLRGLTVKLVENLDGEVGIGVPQVYEDTVEDSTMLGQLVGNLVHTAEGIFLDYDADGIIDIDPDYSPLFVPLEELIPEGDEEMTVDDLMDRFFEIEQEQSSNNGKSFIIMSSDGTMTVYDENGTITTEDCDTAYSLWVAENGIMTKDIDNYSVTEGLLLIMALITAVFGVRTIFKRKDVF